MAEFEVHHIRRITVKLADDERPVIKVGPANLLVGAATLEVTEPDDRIIGLITVWGHWVNAPRSVQSTQLHPAALPASLAPFVEKMVTQR